MKAQDFRVGNCIIRKHNNEYSTISGYDLWHSEKLEDNNHLIEWNNLKPITLTEKILLKCGFEKKEFDYFILKYGNNECYFSYKRNNLELCRNMQTTASAEIKHLHQLQNLYFALTNEELKINL